MAFILVNHSPERTVKIEAAVSGPAEGVDLLAPNFATPTNDLLYKIDIARFARARRFLYYQICEYRPRIYLVAGYCALNIDCPLECIDDRARTIRGTQDGDDEDDVLTAMRGHVAVKIVFRCPRGEKKSSCVR